MAIIPLLGMGMFDTLTTEQRTKCLLLEIQIVRFHGNGWIIRRTHPHHQVLFDNNQPAGSRLVVANSFDEALSIYTNRDKGTTGWY